MSDLSFANGVAVSPDQSFVLVVETGAYRIHRVWLNGPKQGQAEVFIENLPGFPDGISSNGKDKFWLAVVTPRNALLDKLLPHPFARKVIARLPKFLQPAPERYSFVLGLDMNGRVIENLQDGSPTAMPKLPTPSSIKARSTSAASAKAPSAATGFQSPPVNPLARPNALLPLSR